MRFFGQTGEGCSPHRSVSGQGQNDRTVSYPVLAQCSLAVASAAVAKSQVQLRPLPSDPVRTRTLNSSHCFTFMGFLLGPWICRRHCHKECLLPHITILPLR